MLSAERLACPQSLVNEETHFLLAKLYFPLK